MDLRYRGGPIHNRSLKNTLESAQQARSSVVEHHLDMVVVGGSIPLAPTKLLRSYLVAAAGFRGDRRQSDFARDVRSGQQ